MGKLYVVCNSYQPNTASTNRILSFVRGFSELGVESSDSEIGWHFYCFA